ncbi:MAG: protein-export chaperone SecB [Gammaproteobacteria bacterium]|nr:protein-export chaperone SecB [Gammaproteobacteria bacterium]
MASTNPGGDGNGSGAATTPARQFNLRQLYIKDVSFESPNTPAIFSAGAVEPDVKMNLQSSNRQVGTDAWEVVLQINVHATAKEKSLFMVEIEQAGLFQVAGYTAEETQIILGTHCPATLFPYARELISSLVGRGGFPTLLLQPINFEALFQQSQQARSKAAAAS